MRQGWDTNTSEEEPPLLCLPQASWPMDTQGGLTLECGL